MRSSFWVAVLMIFMGAFGLFGNPRVSVPPVGWAIGGLLVAAGGLIFTGRRWAFYLALGAGTLMALSGVAALTGRPEWSLPVHPVLAILVGLYLCVRVAISRRDFR